MERTPHYQLSKWQKTDRILMEDFNSDHQKIDAALAALAANQTEETSRVNAALAAKASTSTLNSVKSALQAEDARLDGAKLQVYPLINEVFTGDGTKEHLFSLNGKKLSDYYMLFLSIGSRGSTTRPALRIVPPYGGCHYSIIYNSNSMNELAVMNQPVWMVLFPMKDEENFFRGIDLFSFHASEASCKYGMITGFTLNIESGGFDGTFTFKLLGVK